MLKDQMKIGNFPDMVNENAARLVAVFVFTLSTLGILLESNIPAFILLYGFFARVLYGPKYEPIALFTLHVICPFLKLADKKVFGPPKRFAQFIGLIFTIAGLIFFHFGEMFYFILTFSILSVFAFLEGALGFCAGCYVFSLLIRWNLVPASICEKCSKIDYTI